jgi:hypothetical protein
VNDIERAMLNGEIVLDAPAVTCGKLGHRWYEVVSDTRGDEPLYFERCERCGAERVP